MNSFNKLAMATGLAALVASGAQAQLPGAACGCPTTFAGRTPQNISTLVDGNGNLLNASTSLNCNTLYTLDARMYVNDGQDLFIQPGTVILATFAPTANAIIVSKGGQIWADGTASCPIIMTAAADPLDGSYAVTNRGQWGSLLILGRAYTNKRTADGDGTATPTDGVGTIEGLAPGDPRHEYGMPIGQELDNESSGILRYVSLRHGGQIIGANNEINGLTLGGVGRGTILEHIEVISNKDDAFEFFGGTVNAKYLVAAHCDDDYIDWDQGYSGKIQFVYGLQGPDNGGGALDQGDHGFEIDGDDNATNNGLKSNATVYNATLIARNLNDNGVEAKERTNGSIYNSVLARFNNGVNIVSNVAGFWNSGAFNVKNSTFVACNNPLVVSGVSPAVGSPEHTKFFTTDKNLSVASLPGFDPIYNMPLPGNAIAGGDRVDPVPSAGSALTDVIAPTDGFFTFARYRGAFEPGSTPWTQSWTGISQIGADVTSAAGCTGDLNNDGIVNASDFTLFSNAFGGNCF